MQPDTLLRESLRFGFEREGVAVAACGPGDSFEPDLFERPAELVIAGGRNRDEARSVLALVRSVLAEAPRKPPVLYVGNGIARSQAIEEGATEFLGQPVFVRDAVTVARLLAGRRHEDPAVLTGDLGQHFGFFYVVRAISALQRRGVLTLVRGMRRGELRFYDGEVTSAQVGPLHGLAALHQLLLWTEGRFELRPEDLVRRQQIPLSPAELFADAERFLSEIVSVAGKLAPSACYDRDEQQIGRVDGRIPREVAAVLDLFDGTRTLADVVEDCPYRVFETLRIANRLHELGLILMRGGSRAHDQEHASLMQGTLEASVARDRANRAPGYVVVSKPGQGGAGTGAHGGPRGVSGAQRAVARGRKVKDRRRHGGLGAGTPDEAAAPPVPSPAPVPAAASADAQQQPLVVDWAQVIPGAIGSELAVSPVVPSSAAAGEISVAARAPEPPVAPPRERVAASALAEQMTRAQPSGAGLRPPPEEPILLTKKISPGRKARPSPAELHAEPVPEPAIEPAGRVPDPAAEPATDRMTAPPTEQVAAPHHGAPHHAAPHHAAPHHAPPHASPAPRSAARPASGKPRPASQPKLFSASEEAFFAKGAELGAGKADSFEDLDDGYLPQGFWRRLFRNSHAPVRPRRPRRR